MEFSRTQTELAANGIFPYGSIELARFEQQMARYFGREYTRRKCSSAHPESYGISSFLGEMTPSDCRAASIEQHYDKEFAVFRAFLDEEYLAYTMAYYGSTPMEIEAAPSSLEDAQKRKYRLVVDRAQIEDGQRILDIGCGFGGLSKYLLENFQNVSVTAVNPSDMQCVYIRACKEEPRNALSSDRFRLIHAFFDQIPDAELGTASYDRIISLGLLEHISNMDLLFEKIARLLAHKGKTFHHCIVSIPTIPQFLDSGNTMMGLYYPSAHIWPFSEPARHCTHVGLADKWFINGLNYWRTLDSWHKRFWSSIDQLFPSQLNKSQVDDWNKYFSLCKAMFAPCDGTLYGNGQYLYEI